MQFARHAPRAGRRIDANPSPQVNLVFDSASEVGATFARAFGAARHDLRAHALPRFT